MTFGSRLDPRKATYYSNLTGFWHGGLHLLNLTSHDVDDPTPIWRHLADAFINELNMSALPERLGEWNWSRSDKVSLSMGDKLLSSTQDLERLPEDVAMIHVRRHSHTVTAPC